MHVENKHQASKPKCSFIGMCMAIGVMSLIASDAHALDRTLDERRAREHSAWREIPYERPAYGEKTPRIPAMRKLAIDVSELILPWSKSHQLLEKRLLTLIRQNIAPEVSGELSRLIETRNVKYVMDPYLKGAAAFSVEDGKAVFSINARTLANLDSKDAVLMYMLVLAHEFVHYKQWRRNIRNPIAQALFDGHGSRELDAGMCKLLWSNEHEAYHRECELSNKNRFSWKIIGEDRADMCVRINSDSAFDQALYYFLMYPGMSEMRIESACKEVWWDEAGGPRIENE